MNEHGLGDWAAQFDNARRRNGYCQFYPFKMISLSENYIRINSDELILDTILHEIAHALVGPNHGHDDAWKAMCVKIGARPERCKADVVPQPRTFIGVCQCCGHKWYRFRRIRNGIHVKDKGKIMWRRNREGIANN